jgi:uncharacterized membrane protein YgdD (TMEM256/DUF423 family)
MEKKPMSKSVKKGVSSLSFSMSRLYRAITTVRPSSFVVSALVVAVGIFLFGGGLYDLIVKPLPAVYYQGQFLFLYPQLSEQFISDSIVAMTLYAFGAIGLIMIYQSTKYVYKPRQAYMMLMMGIVLLLIAYIFLEESIHIKLGR